MKNALGIFLIITGFIVAGYGLSMPTSVKMQNSYSGEQQEVNNIGLISDKQNTLLVGCVIFLSGIIFCAAYNENIEREIEGVKKTVIDMMTKK